QLQPTPLQARGLELLTRSLPIGAAKGRADFCNACHDATEGVRPGIRASALFLTGDFKNNGLPASTDTGRHRVTGLDSDRGRFSVPTVRNVGVTGPYMHNGRLATLRDVVVHYSAKIAASATLSSDLMSDGKPIRLALSDADIDAVVAALEMFTDQSFLTHPAYSNPFPSGR
ncbi:MAG: cytochrome c peroxidase, partial [Myxococcota bacterium]